MNTVTKELAQTDPNQQRVQQDKAMLQQLNNQHLTAENSSSSDLGTELEKVSGDWKKGTQEPDLGRQRGKQRETEMEFITAWLAHQGTSWTKVDYGLTLASLC